MSEKNAIKITKERIAGILRPYGTEKENKDAVLYCGLETEQLAAYLRISGLNAEAAGSSYGKATAVLIGGEPAMWFERFTPGAELTELIFRLPREKDLCEKTLAYFKSPAPLPETEYQAIMKRLTPAKIIQDSVFAANPGEGEDMYSLYNAQGDEIISFSEHDYQDADAGLYEYIRMIAAEYGLTKRQSAGGVITLTRG